MTTECRSASGRYGTTDGPTVKWPSWRLGESPGDCGQTLAAIRPSANVSCGRNTTVCRCSFDPSRLFAYRYLFRLGFMDGTEGFIFWVLQTFWAHFLIDAKIWEKRHAAQLDDGRRSTTHFEMKH